MNDFLEKPTIDECLSHHGVKGMRWGRRKAKKASSGSKSKVNKTYKMTEEEKLATEFAIMDRQRREMQKAQIKVYSALMAIGGTLLATEVLANHLTKK